MSGNDIREYARLMGELGLTGLELRDGDHVVRLERNVAVPQAIQAAAHVPAPAAPAEDQEGGTVCSPMVGVFYRAPAENAAPYVQVGDRVEKGTVLCLIEAMKMMNEITAEEEGIVAEICVENGQVVDFGKPLFRLRK